MRILFLNHNVIWRGGFFRAYHWGRHLARRGHDVTLVTISENDKFRFCVREHQGLHLVTTPDWMSGRLRSGWDVWDTLQRIAYLLPKEFDLVHSVDSRPVCVLPGLALQRLRDSRLVLDWGDWWGHGGTIAERSGSIAERLFAPVETFFEEGFRSYADGSVVLTRALEQRLYGLGVRPETIVRIPHGADIETVRPRDKQRAREHLGLRRDEPIVGYVGTMLKSDKCLTARTFEAIRMRNPHVRLLLIGRGTLRPEDFDVKVRGAVSLTGQVEYEELQEYIAACDVMLLPLTDNIANRGRFPSKISDYLAAGRPVVATTVGDVALYYREDPIGILSDDEPEALAQATVDLLASPYLEELGRNARRVAETQLSWSALTDQLETLYRRVCQS
jgi:glycosyltransferase involved in cell wall biosynthesis